jgi:quercetin dioxygenase-like cupin family protein
MAIVSSLHYAPFDEGDPDDFRPNSKWALAFDPGEGGQDFVDNITVIFEEIAPGDRIPLHTHPIHEVIVIDEGEPEVTLGNETREVDGGTVVFVPAGAPHRVQNASNHPVRIHAMFPSERIAIEYLERNPAPGTEDDAPQPVFTIDARSLSGS